MLPSRVVWFFLVMSRSISLGLVASRSFLVGLVLSCVVSLFLAMPPFLSHVVSRFHALLRSFSFPFLLDDFVSIFLVLFWSF